VRYAEIQQQPTTVGRAHGAEAPVAELLRSAGLRVALVPDAGAWLQTHAVFVTAACAAILDCGGDAAALAADARRTGELIAAVREGFRALARNGVAVTPRPLRTIFTRVPRFAATRYWQGQLRGPLGTVALAPHARASRATELPALCADVRALVAGGGPAPQLERLLATVERAAPATVHPAEAAR
jgi:2-dehydropantoate 2-reductase